MRGGIELWKLPEMEKKQWRKFISEPKKMKAVSMITEGDIGS